MNIPTSYEKFAKQMISLKYRRVERDDRILDILPKQTREKGVELWEKIHAKKVTIIRLRLPYNPKKTNTFSLPLFELETALHSNTQLSLDNFIVLE